jgi:hypothetical protein
MAVINGRRQAALRLAEPTEIAAGAFRPPASSPYRLDKVPA